jgi:hypothetical protein
MAQQQINVGSAANDGTGDKLRDALIISNANATDAEPRLLKADTALQVGDTISSLINNAGYITTGIIAGDNVSELVNDEGYIKAGTIDMAGNAIVNQIGMVNDIADEGAQARALVCSAVSTGILTGGVVTVNVNPALFDVSAGTGLIIDWTGPAAPQRKFISWDALVAQTVPSLASQFTALYFDATGTLVKDSGVVPDGADFRLRIYLQSIVHQSGVQIDSVSSGSNPAYEVAAALYDYVRFLGPLNKGNCFAPNGTNLTFDKDAGQTALPFINRSNDPQNPTVQTDSAITGVSNFSYNYRNGAGGFTFVFPSNAIDPSFYDDGTGTLNAVTNNRFTIQRFYWFPQSSGVTVTYGQAEYQTIADAKAAIQIEEPAIDPIVANNGSFTAALIVQEGATDLSDPLQAEFVCMDI